MSEQQAEEPALSALDYSTGSWVELNLLRGCPDALVLKAAHAEAGCRCWGTLGGDAS